MKVAVTGAAGFVGRNLVDQLVARGDSVVAIDRQRPSTASAAAVTWVAADILDPEALTSAFDGVDLVYHLVAVITLRHTDENAWRINTEGVRNVAEAALAAGVRRMVHCSSIHSFDQYKCGGTIDELSARSDSTDLPVYDRSKWAGEQELQKVIAKGLDAVICNPTAVYGPVDHAPYSRINGMLRDSARGRVPALITGGFDLVDVRDVAAGLILAAEHGKTGENYLLTGEMTEMVEAFRMVAREAGRRGPAVAFPMRWVQAILPVAEPLCKLFKSDLVSKAALGALEAQPVVDGTKARRDLGFAPRPTTETMRDYVDFLVDAGQLQRRRATSAPRPAVKALV
ncbi:NAD-dependent epimerase/dehydratase family protein [Gordonia rubripertincta]|jgi:dihydroflavonol-4-reductase|uniref:NAD-dependent epimerase/dehydratase family protein n=1 Tax=Gordonia rubripertincta TaxID=36822 RepID=A0ABT4N494_GORRU|nr:NAD-dependent epimerase/dehydratase family protein [Gordonia rubripertincta]MCZ4553231.1 NAD-dependent epimerase/dehydratase family protein [Gordonia rubripertincta]